MTALSSYSTGTVAVSADGTTVTGTSTLWLNTGNVKPGDLFQSGHFCVPITDVVDDTHLTITPWPGSTLSGASYVVWKVSQQRIVGETYAADVAKMVGALNTSGFYVFVDIAETVPDPSLGDDGQYAFQPTTGKTWAKVAGVWSFLGIYKAFQLKGAWSGATAYAAGDVVSLSGSSYVCVLDHTNHTPPNATYWQLLASIGATGNTGPTGAGYGGTSTTSLAIGTGSKVFTTQAGLAYTNGARVRASSAANTSNWMEGLATYSGTTLTINVDKTNGGGTLADWNFNVVGQPGAGDLSSANNLSDLANAATARSNLGIPTIMRSYLAGLTLSTAGGSGTFGIAVGVAANSTNTDVMTLVAAYTKTASAWSVGSGGGALDTGSLASTWYHVYLIKRPDTGVVDVCFSASASAPTVGGSIPSAYTLFRRIGSIFLSPGSVWRKFVQVGDEFLLDANVVELGASAIANTTANTLTLAGVPTGVAVNALFHGAINPGASANGVLYTSLDESDVAVLGLTGSRNASLWAQTSGSFQTGDFNKRTNTSAQIRWRAFAAQGDVSVYTLGWVDRRGRDV